MGSRAVRAQSLLAWDGLVELYGDEETIKLCIEELKASGLDIEEDLVELAERYLDGWRPREWGESPTGDDAAEEGTEGSTA